MYKTVVVKYSPKAKEMAARIEETANKMEQKGFELVSCSIMPSSKGILVFKKTPAHQSTESNTPQQAMGHQTCSAAELRGI